MFFEDRDKYTYEFKIMYELGGLNEYLEIKPRGYRLYVTKYVDSGNFMEFKQKQVVLTCAQYIIYIQLIY